MSNYPAPSGHRIPYDRDGSKVYKCASDFSSPSQLSVSNVQGLNGGTAAYGFGQGTSSGMLLLLSQPMDITHMVGWLSGSAGAGTVQTSINTTSGLDGDWINVATSPFTASSRAALRTLTPDAATSVKGIRFTVTTGLGNSYLQAFHIYGVPHAYGDQLVLWDAALDQRADPALFDFGDVPQTTSSDKQFRVYNNSSTQTASTITISCETLNDTTPSVPPQFTFSTDGVTFGTTATISSLGPSATSGVITVRRTTPSNAALSLWWARIVASAASWA